MSVEEYQSRFDTAVEELWEKLGRVPAVREIAERMRLSERTLYRWGEEDRAGTGSPAVAAEAVVRRLRGEGARAAREASDVEAGASV